MAETQCDVVVNVIESYYFTLKELMNPDFSIIHDGIHKLTATLADLTKSAEDVQQQIDALKEL